MNEKRRILQMVAAGKITAREGEKLLTALQKTKSAEKLYIQITRENASKPSLNLAIPMKYVHLGWKLLPSKLTVVSQQAGYDLSQLNWQQINSMASAGEKGELFYTEITEKDGSTSEVRVFIE
ncbi:MAG: hypothetical protein PWQ09_985 [Candidatus Cloacimonadota bacterium]|nr:hypothetical protein [Candidatus Cloacimonadota bacterium]